jgi:hypothetical protein
MLLPYYIKDGCRYELIHLLRSIEYLADYDSVKLYLRCYVEAALLKKPCATPLPSVGSEAQWVLDMTMPLFEKADEVQLSALLNILS